MLTGVNRGAKELCFWRVESYLREASRDFLDVSALLRTAELGTSLSTGPTHIYMI